ncbi:hypothetical protein OBBRIDRAFT_888468 [Obba rivulosa]|uniref:F-box domain protein n=1 Tax=Obba rivulosa TaxID=1052685 RepID=A0A8E2AQZ4_9APHY|nr:hypothetical protein OBBRIDRAFT_888468 [Obba rivulosa]
MDPFDTIDIAEGVVRVKPDRPLEEVIQSLSGINPDASALCLSGYDDCGMADDPDDWSFVDTLIPYLSRLRNVRTLQLDDMAWKELSPTARSFILTHFRSLTALRFKTADMLSSNQLLRVLDAFPSLSTLVLDSVDAEVHNHTTQQITRETPLRLNHLRIQPWAWHRPLCQWILGSRGDNLYIDTAMFNWTGSAGAKPDLVVGFIRDLAPHLKQLTMDWCIPLKSFANKYANHLLANAPNTNDGYGFRVGTSTPFDASRFEEDMLEDDEEEPDKAVLQARLLRTDEPSGPDSCRRAIEYISHPIQSAIEDIDAFVIWNNNIVDTFMIRVLCQLVNLRTTVFRIMIAVKDWTHFETVDWPALDIVLSSVPDYGVPAQSRDFAILLSGPWSNNEVARRKLMSKLPKVAECGLFAFEGDNDHTRWAMRGLYDRY